MENLMHELAERGDCTFKIFLYGRFFNVSRIGGKIDDLWFDIGSEALEPNTRIKTREDLVAFIKQYVPNAPRNDQMIVFNTQNAVYRALADKETK